MDSSQENNQNKTLTLSQAAQMLSVSIDILLQWNDLNILKPTITSKGQIVYSQKQIEKFLEIQQLALKEKKESAKKVATDVSTKTKTEITKPSHTNKNYLFPIGLGLFFLGVIITVFSITFIFHNKLAFTADETQEVPQKMTEEAGKILSSQNVDKIPSSNTPNNDTLIAQGNKFDTGLLKKT